MKELTIKETEKINKNLKAFNANFEEIKILKFYKNYYIFIAKNINSQYSNYIQTTANIEYINGWLYGAVQAKNKIVKAK